MAIQDDFSIAIAGDIRYTGTTTNYTVLELHRWLQDLMDDAAAAGNDLLDITDQTASERSTDNIITLINSYNIDDTAAQHLYDGSITQDSGDTVYSGLVVVGAVESGTQLQIIQDGALLTSYWSTGLNEDATQNILLRLMIKTRVNGVDIDGKRLRVQARELSDSYAEFSLTAGLGNATAAIFTANDLNNQTASGTIDLWTDIVNVEGLNLIDVDGNAVNEEYYSQWDRASRTLNQLYERTKWLQRRGTPAFLHGLGGELFRGVTHSLAYDGEAGTGPSTNDDYAWGLKFNYDGPAGSPSLVIGEAVTFSVSSAKGRVLAIDDNGATGSLIVSVESGTPGDNNVVTGATTGATVTVNGSPVGQATGGGIARLLAVDDDGTTGNLYVQLLRGTAPADNAIMYYALDHARTATVNGSPTARTVKPEFIGASTGSAIIGAYGIGIQAADLNASSLLTDLGNNARTPPNNVTFTVSGLVSGEDRVLVGPESGSALDLAQFTLNGALSGAAVVAVVVNGAIPSDTPTTGTIRIELASGIYRRVAYTSWVTSTFTIGATDFSSDNAPNGGDVFISYIDKLATATSESFTAVYSTDRSLFIRIRDGGGTPIKTFETTGTLGSAGGSATAIRTTDA